MASRKIKLYGLNGKPYWVFAFENVSMVRDRMIGSHLLSISLYYDPNTESQFFGLALDCVIVRKGTMAECEAAWRSHVRALAKGGSHGKA